MMKSIASVTILGSTGTIGVNTLDVISRNLNKYCVYALAANTNVDLLFKQCQQYQPKIAVMVDEQSAEALASQLRDAGLDSIEVLSGLSGLEKVSSSVDCDVVMAGIVGAAGLLPTLAAAKAGKRILLANKEALVMSGKLLMDLARQNGATLLPVDSEHNAIWQCLPIGSDAQLDFKNSGVEQILLTASGGPFRKMPLNALDDVTPEQACAHPNWEMGPKISVDSATMMNKGLELIEACWLFNVQPKQIQVVIHPESIIHSLVTYKDGSVIAQLGNPDMRTPIAYALSWPERIESGVEPLDLFRVASLNFEKPDYTRFPNLHLAEQAVSIGGTASAILNAANEVAVSKFLDRKIKFTDISGVIEHVLENVPSHDADTIDVILEDDRLARESATVAIDN